ncbi:MAG TPA: amidohydrolase family protein [Bryobacteraceae bacterium]|jgi:Tol biopolymer transport system component|nr:amidohydrolase family protein [Bryobacteraceae bacterium]
MIRTSLFGLLAIALLAQDPKPPAKKPGLPLKPERKIEFTTDEGTWLSLTLTPDGKTIVFEMLGHLYSLPVTGGEAKLLTTGMAFDSQPSVSPDGKHIAFVSDRDGSDNLWICTIDGAEPKQLSKDPQGDFESPSWTPDGDYVLVSRKPNDGLHEVWMYHIQGGSGVQVTKSSPAATTPPQQRLRAVGVVASPDGKYFYYARRTGNFTYNTSFPIWQVVRRDRITGDEDVITSAPGSAFRPVISPDGSKLVFGTRQDTETGLRVRDLTTGEEKWLKYGVQRDDQESAATRDVLPGYAFTPDSRDIIVSYGGKIHRVQISTGEASDIPFTAKVSQDLGPELKFASRVEEGAVKARLIQTPSESPVGKRLVFSSLTHLYKVDAPGGKAVRITSSNAREFQPAWSPDGQWIVYVTWSDDGGDIWKLRADGSSAPVKLTRIPAFYRDPVWSPDSKRIVALRQARQARLNGTSTFAQSGIGMDVIWVPADGGDATLIVPARGTGRPHFTHDAERIYVYSNQGLQSFRWDGTDRRTIMKVEGRSRGPQPTPASDVRISPDGKHALAKLNEQLFLIAMPAAGGEVPTINVNTPAVPVKKLTDIGADDFQWAEDGKTMTWALGSSFFRQALSTVTYDPVRADSADGEKKEEEAAPAPKKSLAEEVEIGIEQPRRKATGSIVLRGAKIITMKGDEVIPDGDLVVTDNRIVAVGKRGTVQVPAGARVMDLKGATIMPGIIDVHAHWIEVARGELDPQSWVFMANLAYGVTSGRDPQTSTNDVFAYQDLIDMGEMLGPRAFNTGPGIFSSTNFQSLDEARNVVARYKKYYRTNTVKSYMVGNRKQREWMVMACKENGIMPTTEGGLDLKLDLTHALDGFSGNEHALPIVPLYKDVVEIFARSGISYTPTLLVAYGGPWAENYFYETTTVHDDPKLRRFIPHDILDERAKRRPWFSEEEQVFPKLAAEAAKIVRAGGRVCIGGHGQLQGIQCHWEMWALKSGGLTNHQVLRSATLYGAQAIGYDQDLGSIEPGKLADVLVLNKDPLENIRNTNTIRFVMKGGDMWEADTLNQVWPIEKKLAEPWWWKDQPTK